MKAIFSWTEKQKNLLQKMDLPFDFTNVDETNLADFEEAVGEYLQLHGIGDDDEVNDSGLICETILDEIAKI